MKLSSFIADYVLLLVGAVALVALYYELRRKRFEPAQSNDHVFRCEKCGLVYTDDPDVDQSRCPQCGLINDSITF